MGHCRLVSWNINSVRARLDLVQRFCSTYQPTILCLQETKASDPDFPIKAVRALGFEHIYLHGQRMHHGVAVLSKLPLAAQERQDWQANGEARHIGVRLPNGVMLHNVYVPAGGDVPDAAANPKFGQKLAYLQRMIDWSQALSGPAILLGDFNVAPLPEDVWNHKALLSVVSHTPAETALLRALAESHAWVDLGRRFTPTPERLFTWWSYRAKDWRASDRGRRLDHIWLSPALADSACNCMVAEDARGWDKPSDHAPVIADFDWPDLDRPSLDRASLDRPDSALEGPDL